jgi:hypothetical protein
MNNDSRASGYVTLTENGSDPEPPKPLRPMPSWVDYGNSEVDRRKYHVGEGFIEIGGFIMLIGPSYVGKSTLLTQISINLAIGRSWLFLKSNAR